MNPIDDCDSKDIAGREIRPDSDAHGCALKDAAVVNQDEKFCEESTRPGSKSSAFTQAMYYWVLSRF